MKKAVLPIVIILVLSTIQSFSWTKGGVTKEALVVDPHDDSTLIIINVSDEIGKGYFAYPAYVIDLKSQKILSTFGCANSMPDAYAVNYNYKLLALTNSSYNSLSKLAIYNYMTGELLLNVDVIGVSSSENLAFSSDGENILVFDSKNMIIKSWNIPSKAQNNDIVVDVNPSSAHNGIISPDGERICFRINDSLQVMSVKTGELIDKFKMKAPFFINEYEPSSYFRFGASNNLILYADSLHYIRIYDINKSKHIAELFNPKDKFYPDINFSKTMKYIFARQRHSLSMPNGTMVWNLSIVGDTIPKYSYDRNIAYFSDNAKKALAVNSGGVWCGYNAEMPTTGYSCELFNIGNDSTLATYPDGFAGFDYPEILLSPDGLYLGALSSFELYPYKMMYNLALTNISDSTYIKSLNLRFKPLAFTSGSRYLILSDTNRILLYDIWAEIYKDSITTELNKIIDIEYNATSNLLVCADSNKVEIYDLSDLSLIKKIELADQNSYIKFCRMDSNGISSIFTSDYHFIRYDINTKEINDNVCTNLKLFNGEIEDISKDGKYALVHSKPYYSKELSAWDLKNDTKVFSDTVKKLHSDYFQYYNSGFIKAPELIYCYWQDDPFNLTTKVLTGMNLSTKVQVYLGGDDKAYLSVDSLHYAVGICPTKYRYESIPPELLSDVGVNDDVVMPECVSVYPNPARDRIFIKPGNNIVNPVVVVYNLQGERVEAPIMANLNNLEISTIGLPSGMYFVRIANGGEVLTKSFVVVQ